MCIYSDYYFGLCMINEAPNVRYVTYKATLNGPIRTSFTMNRERTRVNG